MTDDERRDLVALSLVTGVGPLTGRALIDHFGSATQVLDATVSSLRHVSGVGEKLATRIASARTECDPDAEIERCRAAGVRIVGFSEPEYPEPLRTVPDPPLLLYVRGRIDPVDAIAVGIVGSRRCTPYGVRIAEKLATGLARAGLTIVSGLARGIDAAAHRGALRGGGRTIGVLANGLSQIYPEEHEPLAAEMAASGAVVTEMTMTQQPWSELFPRRNRIIAGMSLGVIVVEAAPRSGSLGTAHHAMEQNREVFAVPGPVDSLASRGCHRLIRDGAKLVETVDDVLEELGPLARAVVPVRADAPDDDDTAAPTLDVPASIRLADRERVVLTHVAMQPVGVDELIGRTGLAAREVLAALPVLELRRLVKRLPGNLFIRA
jgi:DNA processing protein